MNGLLVGFLLGVVIGGLTTALAFRWRRRSTTASDHDYADLCAEVRIHAEAMRSQVELFADELAAGDPQLREKLRVFEGRSLR